MAKCGDYQLSASTRVCVPLYLLYPSELRSAIRLPRRGPPTVLS